jgi:hypothetical protein
MLNSSTSPQRSSSCLLCNRARRYGWPNAQLAKQVQQTAPLGSNNAGETVTRQPPIPGQQAAGGIVAPRPRPRRFYAKVALDPNRPTPQVSNIAQSILSELDRVRGTRMTLTLDIDAEIGALAGARFFFGFRPRLLGIGKQWVGSD